MSYLHIPSTRARTPFTPLGKHSFPSFVYPIIFTWQSSPRKRKKNYLCVLSRRLASDLTGMTKSTRLSVVFSAALTHCKYFIFLLIYITLNEIQYNLYLKQHFFLLLFIQLFSLGKVHQEEEKKTISVFFRDDLCLT